jgi:hypothetical protein
MIRASSSRPYGKTIVTYVALSALISIWFGHTGD